MTTCPCCGEGGIEKGHNSKPYLCDACEYIDDDIGEWVCRTCGIRMEESSVFHHKKSNGYHEIERA